MQRWFFCLKRFFGDHQIIRFKSWLQAIENIQQVNDCDYVLIGAGGLIFRGFNRYQELIKSITKPLGCIGISIEADSLNHDMKKGLDLLKTKCDFIYVRDNKSREILEYHYKVIVGPDISYLYPYPVIKKPTSKDICALNLRNWFWWDSELFSEEHETFSRRDSKYKWYKTAHYFNRWDPDNLVRILKRKFKHVNPYPLYFGGYDITDNEILSKYFTSVSKTYDHAKLTKSRYLVGMRLHSLIFACQSGIPFISLSYEPKNINYCNDIGLPELSIPPKKYRQIRKKIKYLKNNYDTIRNSLIHYTHKANLEALHIFEGIKILIESNSIK